MFQWIRRCAADVAMLIAVVMLVFSTLSVSLAAEHQGARAFSLNSTSELCLPSGNSDGSGSSGAHDACPCASLCQSSYGKQALGLDGEVFSLALRTGALSPYRLWAQLERVARSTGGLAEARAPPLS